ncbi:PREDICTED: peroxisomal nicotinamide adenine dinucleotide carrier-like isoform X2 [Populus euphratica]|uniref:Peroxisomal nicotinamide adenine dinucleotide carrier-like isoform X2 n=1 Tax=Populus euphratica TaxID=75702 RepID=A0AAJ6V4U3_POPEU|nr:PREDICTED: peroxisomal nicotinamide adenine dinucleotide carrier-like isoform X2 [Populus euphratica]
MSDALISGLAGAGGGIIAQLITYPLQTVNTRQRTERDVKRQKGKHVTIEVSVFRLNDMWVIKNEGCGRLYSGLAPSVVGAACSQGVYYYFYQIFRDRAEAIAHERKMNGIGDGSVGMLSSLVVAALAGCTNVLLTNPIWVVVTRMQTHRKNSKKSQLSHSSIAPAEKVLNPIEPPPYRTGHTTQELYDEAGIWGFWKGVFPTLIMVSKPSIQFMLYETMLKKLKTNCALVKQGDTGVSALEIFLLGALANLGATVVTYPLLVVKSRLQAKQITNGDKRHHYEGSLDAILKTIRYEGFHGFYKGMSMKIVQSVLAAAVLFMIKERTCQDARFLLTKGGISTSKTRPT